ncbi:glycoside hydrolase family 2 TIM barrel-domain containing protein [Pontibacter diazotrophicus]|uniref:glycoside hydrolase family 2 TIM barrel-domain containing protein n=1 Tax=Pontibacter diazotrophicus TaxID=1400979 RepID=UPI001FE4FA42|nr:glycoside hydrolase family 2 TIM barrel-domain containing protein [Pontibacter diazotrophicus]
MTEKYVRKGRKVEIVKQDDQFVLLRNGEPYFIKGAGGYTNFDKIKENGGNSVRVWHAKNAQQVLDEAHKHGLTVTLGLWMAREREGFNYYDKKLVAQQLKEFREVVHRYKDHPALLMWGVGNEVNMDATNSKVWDAVNEVAEMIHEVDPDHPTTTMLIGLRIKTINLVTKECPAIDVISFNMFANMKDVEKRIKLSNWKGPYLVSEFGARGAWETYTTLWDAPLEQTSSEKASFVRERYLQNISPDIGRCIGGYVFFWGHKQEYTPTWFSLMSKTGEETETVDVMRELWTGDTSGNKAPYVAYIQLKGSFDFQSVFLEPGQEYGASVYAFDPDGDSLRVEWEVLPETYRKLDSNSKDILPNPVPNVIGEASGKSVRVHAPKKEGPYRLYAYIYDGHNNVATANFPFYVSSNPPY